MIRRLSIGFALLTVAACAAPDPQAVTTEERCWWRHTCFETTQTQDGRQVHIALDYKGSYEPFTIVVRAEQAGMAGTWQPVRRLTIHGPKRVEILSLVAAGPDGYRWNWRFQQHPGDRPAVHDDSTVYRLPYREGEAYPVLQGYGGLSSHDGDNFYSVDWAMPVGTPVLAARAGVVVAARGDSVRKGEGWDNHVIVRHDDGTYAWYLHLQPGGVDVAAGQRVAAGDRLGRSGDTGYSSEPHLHFQVSAVSDDPEKTYDSFPTRFRTADGIVETPRVGETYRAAAF